MRLLLDIHQGQFEESQHQKVYPLAQLREFCKADSYRVKVIKLNDMQSDGNQPWREIQLDAAVPLGSWTLGNGACACPALSLVPLNSVLHSEVVAGNESYATPPDDFMSSLGNMDDESTDKQVSKWSDSDIEQVAKKIKLF